MRLARKPLARATSRGSGDYNATVLSRTFSRWLISYWPERLDILAERTRNPKPCFLIVGMAILLERNAIERVGPPNERSTPQAPARPRCLAAGGSERASRT